MMAPIVEWMDVGPVAYGLARGVWYQAYEPVTEEVSRLLDEIRQLRSRVAA